jgi:hypothetical protein
LDGALLFYSPNISIIWVKQMIPQRLRELIMNAEREKVAREFWAEIEKEAEKLEVTSDYILQEFYLDDKY